MDTGTAQEGPRPRGGVRPGAGRPKSMKVPPDLEAPAARVWRQWAPLAVRQRTLTRETAPAFAVICTAAAALAASLPQGADPVATAQLCRLVFDGLTAFQLAPPPPHDPGPCGAAWRGELTTL